MGDGKTNTSKTVLDRIKQREICAILQMGCSRRAAARYVGCSPSTIVATAAREEDFRRQLDHAEQMAVLGHMRNLQQAAKKSQYWRAAAWFLERRNPEDYGPRRAHTFTMEQVRQLLNQLAEIVVNEVPAASQRKRVLERFGEMVGELEEA